MECPLCQKTQIEELLEIEEKQHGELRKQKYYQCGKCDLVFLQPSQRLKKSAEKQRYQTHNNDPNDENYLNFLKQVWLPVSELVDEGAWGLDIGCGPNPVLADYIEAQGYHMNYWDPFFHPKEPNNDYDFLLCTEVIEHMYEPLNSLEKWNRRLRSRGVVGLMTKLYPGRDKFADWYYRKDPTHVCFYTENSLSYLAAQMGWSNGLIGDQVQIFIKA